MSTDRVFEVATAMERAPCGRAYARNHDFFDGVKYVDYELLRTLKSAAQHLEVLRCALVDWQSAILQGYSVWRPIAKARRGKFRVDLDARTIMLTRP